MGEGSHFIRDTPALPREGFETSGVERRCGHPGGATYAAVHFLIVRHGYAGRNPVRGVDRGGVGWGSRPGSAGYTGGKASPVAPTVDDYLNGTVALEGLAFGTASGFVAVPGGTYQVRVTAAGAALDAAVIDGPTLALVPARAYEIAAIGMLAGVTAAVFEVDVFAIEGDAMFGSSRLRVVHAAPDAPAIDVSHMADDIATKPVAGLRYSDASASAVTAAGTYRVEVAVSGSGEEVLFLPDVTFERDTVYSLYATGLVCDGTLSVLPIATGASRLPAVATPTAG